MTARTHDRQELLSGQSSLVTMISESEPALICHLHNELDINRARYLLSELGRSFLIPPIELMRMITAASELCSNAVKYAHGGVICAWVNDDSTTYRTREFTIKVADEGPGIPNIEWAFREKTSSGGTLGLGLSGTKRLVDSLYIESPIQGRSYGTIITLKSIWHH